MSSDSLLRSNPKGAVVQVWRGGGRWFTNLCLVDGYDKSSGLLSFDADVGCNQGGEGEDFVATSTKVLFNISGSKSNPVRGVSIRGLTLRDTAYTYLGTDVADVHGMPAPCPPGGDWALQRSGAVLAEGTEGFTIDGCLITRVDGNGVFLSNYNRNATISNNEMSGQG
eukprot:gene11584-23135_t